jgi:hypothetical protein
MAIGETYEHKINRHENPWTGIDTTTLQYEDMTNNR